MISIKMKDLSSLHNIEKNCILIAVDSSKHSLNTVNFVLNDLPFQSNKDVVVLVYCLEPPFTSIYSNAQKIVTEMEQKQFDDAKSVVANFMKKFKEKNIQCYECITRSVDTRETLFNAVKLLEPKLLVVGSRGLGTMKGLLLGSVSRYLLKNVEVPVLVVKSKQEEKVNNK